MEKNDLIAFTESQILAAICGDRKLGVFFTPVSGYPKPLLIKGVERLQGELWPLVERPNGGNFLINDNNNRGKKSKSHTFKEL